MEYQSNRQHDPVTQPLLGPASDSETGGSLPTWATPKAKWQLVKVENGLRIFQDISPDRKKGRGCLCCRQTLVGTLKAVAVVNGTTDSVLDLVVDLSGERGQWDPLFEKGRVVEKVDDNTEVVQKFFRATDRRQKARDFCLLRSSAWQPGNAVVVSYRSTQHKKCPVQTGFARSQLKSGGYIVTQLEPQRVLLEHIVELEEGGLFGGWATEAAEDFQLSLLRRLAGAREYLAARFPTPSTAGGPRTPEQMPRFSPSPIRRVDSARAFLPGAIETQMSDVEGEFFDAKQDGLSETASEAGSPPSIRFGGSAPPPLPSFSGSVRRASDAPNGRDCWSIPDPSGFSVRSESYPFDKALEPAKEPFFTLVAVDWFKSDVRIDRLARRPGGLLNRTLKGGPPFVLVVNMQVPAGAVHYSMVYYFASYRPITDLPLFHQFVNGDDAFRDARLTLLPNIPNGSWLIRQSVGSRPVPLAQVLKCRYDKGENFFEIDVDMGTSAIVRYVLSLVVPVVTVLVVDMAFLVRGDTEEELPEVLLGAVRVQTLELTSAIPPPPEA